MYEYRAKLARVVDGDTVVLDIDLGLETFRRITVRLLGVDAPERGTDAGKRAAQWLFADLNGEPLVVRTVKDRREKYGRYLVHLWTAELPQVSVNDRLVTAGHAVYNEYA